MSATRGAAEALRRDGDTGEHGIDTGFELSGGEMGVEVGSRARGGRGDVAVPGQGVGGHAEGLRGPGESQCGAVQLGFGQRFVIEVALADDEEVAGGVVVGGRVAGQVGAAELVDVAAAVDAEVIGDVDPALLVLVVALVLAQAGRGVAVVAEDHAGVVQRQPGHGVGAAAGACRTSPPGIPAQHAHRDLR